MRRVARCTPIFSAGKCVTTLRQDDRSMATCAKRRTKGGRVRKPLEVVLVCSPPREHFRWIVRAALLARLPIFGMTLSVMSPADRLATMIPIATVSRVGKQHVVAFIVTDRVATALRFREPPR